MVHRCRLTKKRTLSRWFNDSKGKFIHQKQHGIKLPWRDNTRVSELTPVERSVNTGWLSTGSSCPTQASMEKWIENDQERKYG